MTAVSSLRGPALYAHPIARAVMQILSERGYPAATIDAFCERAKVSPEVVEHNFQGKAELVVSVFDAYVEDFEADVQAALDSTDRWPDTIRAAAYAVVRWMAGHPAATQFGIVGTLQAPELVRAHRDRVLRWAASLIDLGRAAAPDPDAVPDGAALLVIGSIADGITARVARRTLDDPVALVPELMYLVVRPYLGEEAARRELEIPPPPDLAGGVRMIP